MRLIIRPLAALFLVLASVAALPLSWTLSGVVVALTSNTTALIMGGSFHPLAEPADAPPFVTAYLGNAVTGHLDPAFADASGPVTNAVAVYTPEQFFPIGQLTFARSVAEGLVNLHRCLGAETDCVFNDDPAVRPHAVAPRAGDAMMAFGYSQSAVIASLAKLDLIQRYQPGDPSVSFMLVANPMRPNGGILMRLHGWPTIPILEIPFPGASPTGSAVLPDGRHVYPTVDVARQYDGLGGDFPVRPLNLVATVNALLGYALLHGSAVDIPLAQARFQGRQGDTGYYLVETDLVPLLQPFAFFVPRPILKAIDAPLRVVIEDAYDRDVGPGVATRASWRPIKDIVGLAARLVASIPVAVDNLTEGLGLGRVLGTTEPGAFGVGGPDLPAEPEPAVPDESVEPAVPEKDPESVEYDGGRAAGEGSAGEGSAGAESVDRVEPDAAPVEADPAPVEADPAPEKSDPGSDASADDGEAGAATTPTETDEADEPPDEDTAEAA
ncbi:PE-PPE domain-containing protein [Mycolicibacterium sp. D5.8-2]|uniref:PE-PPE domain-containing protein n=1 Tax=Mycolicibacterium sp. D5.8-2 TaxID=3085903 RepID=UPI00298CA909|nr:PE-PPE domain-containing protein [Mycolicibacterium sp. D5.8-2]MDW5613318.1 PE-PPE domain-containing protein [Mycolicibacterium sp. D5.8-2]